MNTDIRLMIRKWSWLHRQCRRIVNINNSLAYKTINRRGRHSSKLSHLKDSRCGHSCFVLGNGPSLTPEDLERIQGFECFASNGIFRMFDMTTWRPDYYVVQDIYFDSPSEVDAIDCQIAFVGDYYWRKIGTTNPHAVCFHGRKALNERTVSASRDISRFVTDYETVTFASLQIALYMGYSNIYLLGVDHSYSKELDRDGSVIEKSTATSHFYNDDDYNPNVIANLAGMELAYQAAKELAVEKNVRILNATRGGKLDVFERIDLDEILLYQPKTI